ncbi:MAG: glycine cleavage system aminomethyltransferase GcvT [Acidimicrobiales bacterium]
MTAVVPEGVAGASSAGHAALRRTALHDAHVALGAKLVEFGGWEMPVSYPEGTVAEHRACRTAAVAFDVSHLGTVRVEGAEAFGSLQRAFTNDLGKVAPGRAQYTHLLDVDGSVADDIIVWWVSEARFDVMPNASNTARVLGAIGGVDTTVTRAVVAVQGPAARERLATVAPDAAAVAHFGVATFTWNGTECVAAGTGYTGEDGVECAVPADSATAFWEAVLAAGVLPAGLGARDTLRLESGLPLHGPELGPGITPLQAGLGWVIGWGTGEFCGREALERERESGPRRRLRGLLADGRQPPRDGATVEVAGEVVGAVTSGNFSPMLERGIALAFVDTGSDAVDRASVLVRGRALPVTVTGPRFWPPSVDARAQGRRG